MTISQSLFKKQKPFYIMLCGNPCTGKSTWQKQFQEKLKHQSIPVSIISFDDIAFHLCTQYNQINKTKTPLTYTDICDVDEYRKILEETYKKSIIKSNNKFNGIVILDRTHLTKTKRNNDLILINKEFPVHCVVFTISDQAAWNDRLEQRNKKNPEKIVASNIIKKLTMDASTPEFKEGFQSITYCCAIGEQGWEISFKESIEYVISVFNKSELNSCAITSKFHKSPRVN